LALVSYGKDASFDKLGLLHTGARLLKERGYRLKRNGCMEPVVTFYNYAKEKAKGKTVRLTNGWELPPIKRGVDITQDDSHHGHVANRGLHAPPYPMVRRNESILVTAGFPPPEQLYFRHSLRV
jgi:hypothetical protein